LNDPQADSVEEILVVLDVGVFGSDLSARTEEHTVGEFHDRSLVNGGDVKTLVGTSVFESVTGNSGRSFVGDEFDRLNDTVDDLLTSQTRRISKLTGRTMVVRDYFCEGRKLTSCSIPEYSPSVFSRMMTESTLS